MKENELYNSICEGAKLERITLIKIVDGSIGKKPFDIFGIFDKGRSVSIEVKIDRNIKSSHLAPLRENMFEAQQLAYLELFANKGGLSFALVYHLDTKLMHVWSFKKNDWVGTLLLNSKRFFGMRNLMEQEVRS